MTPRTFWAILIKILGLYIILESLASIPQIIAGFSFVAEEQSGVHSSGELFYLSYIIFFMGLYLLLLWACLYKSDWIIDALKLDKGFDDERFEFNIHRSTILKIIVMVTGGILLVDSVPMLCREIFSYFEVQNKVMSSSLKPSITGYIIVYSIKAFFGYFMLTCNRMIVNFMEARRKKAGMDLRDEIEN